MSTIVRLDRAKAEQISKTRWKGAAFPFYVAYEGRFTSKELVNLILSSLYTILTTKRGTRPFRRNFGSAIPGLLFEPNDEVLAAQAEYHTINAIRDPVNGEPRIRVDELNVYPDPNRNTVKFEIMFTILTTNEQVRSTLDLSREGNFATIRTF